MRTSTINIRNLSIRCGNCGTYQTLAGYTRREEWNVYTYECESDTCDAAVTRTYLEVPRDLDEFANRDPNWRGGKKWGGEGGAEGAETGEGADGDGPGSEGAGGEAPHGDEAPEA